MIWAQAPITKPSDLKPEPPAPITSAQPAKPIEKKPVEAKPEPAKPEPVKPELPRPELPKPPQTMESALARQRASINKQVESLKKINPEAFPITRLPGEEPPPPLPSGDLPKQVSCFSVPRQNIDPVVDLAASNAGVSAQLVRAVIMQESAFNPCAVSSKGAQGLMQLMPATARDFGVVNPFDPKQNVEAGASLLRQLLDKYSGDVALALSAYNAGPARVDKDRKVPAITETMNYVRSIQNMLNLE